jgi:hypothetical protein
MIVPGDILLGSDRETSDRGHGIDHSIVTLPTENPNKPEDIEFHVT